MSKTKEPDIQKDYVCHCGKRHTFSPYVFAHWDIELTHKCQGCGAENSILRGRVIGTRYPEES